MMIKLAAWADSCHLISLSHMIPSPDQMSITEIIQCHTSGEYEEDYVNCRLAVSQTDEGHHDNLDLNERTHNLSIMRLGELSLLAAKNKVCLINGDNSLEKQAIMKRSSALCHRHWDKQRELLSG